MNVDFALIADAARTLRPLVVETPLLESPVLNGVAGCRVLVKAENLQRTGSFKYRGACFRLARLSPDERKRGVIAFSSGNFAQALAAAGTAAGIAVTIVMPVDAPKAKIDATRGYGAEVVLSEHGERNREEAANELAMKLAEQRGLVKLHPFDDPLVVAGQASCGVEIARQAVERGVSLDALVVPVGGSGLIAGIALAVKTLAPATRVVAAEPEGFDDLRRSLVSGTRERVVPGARSICDALQAASPGAVPFGAARAAIASGVAVSDAEAVAAMRAAFTHLKLVAEPSGAIGLGAVLSGMLSPLPAAVGVVLSGGNVALAEFARLTAG
ncbi:MAG: threonine/serine dehydratase [Alphaproteobacteria bacterium]|nr:threonine/serine dehydratase [Alphaproteobacteria bacterium]